MDLYCIKNHSYKIVIKGNLYPNLGEMNCPHCNHKMYNVGAKIPIIYDQTELNCSACNNLFKANGINWVTSDKLIPIDDINIEEAIEELNKEELVLINN